MAVLLRPGCRPSRPALTCALAFVAGVAACHSGQAIEWLIASSLAVVLVLLVHRVCPTGLVLLLVCAGLGWVRCELCRRHSTSADLRLHPDSNGQIIFYGHTDGEPDIRKNETRWVFQADSIAYPDSVTPRSGRVLARFRFDPGISPDSRVTLSGRLVPPPQARNPGDFPWSTYLRRKSIHGYFEPSHGSPVLECETSPFGWLSRVVAPFRRMLSNRLLAHLEGEEAALAAGLLLGEREELSQETLDAFRRTGTLHLLAVSGSNVGIVAAVVWGLLQCVRVPRAGRLAGAASAIVLFCFLAHSEASVVRASFAALLVVIAMALRQRVDPLNLWGATLLACVVWQPTAILDVGFQLSFAATLGILLLPEPAGGATSVGRHILRLAKTSILVSTAAQLATLPVLAREFNQIPLVTPLANLFCVPLAGLGTTAATLALLSAPCGDSVLGVMSAALWGCLKALSCVVHAVDRLEVPILLVPSPGGWALVLGVATLLALFALVTRPQTRRRLALLAILGCSGTVFVISAPVEPEILVLDSPGLVALVRTGLAETWLVGELSCRARERAGQAALRLGWRAPTHSLGLQARVEESAESLSVPSSCVWPDALAPASQAACCSVWLGERDSLPFALVIAYSGKQVVLCRQVPAHLSAFHNSDQEVLWATDLPQLCAAVAGLDSVAPCILAGGKRSDSGPLPAQILHTRRDGAIRIRWRDRGFQAEPCAR